MLQNRKKKKSSSNRMVNHRLDFSYTGNPSNTDLYRVSIEEFSNNYCCDSM